MQELINLKLNKADIENRRKMVSDELLHKSGNINEGKINTISAVDLKLIFELYDQIFFNNWFKDNYRGKLKFSLSRRMTKSAGLTICPKNIAKIRLEELTMEIRIGVNFLFQYGIVKNANTVGGIKANNSLDVLLLIFEHEICHVIEFIHYNISNCSKDRFKALAYGLFGHTESFHKLPTYKQIAKVKLGLNIGDTVSFTQGGIKYTGIINNINKRATVMVKDKYGIYKDNRGNRYTKFYVPLALLM